VSRSFRAFVAVVVGNALYFVLLSPHLPVAWRHRPMVPDLGLLLDFVLCAVLYLLLNRFASGDRKRPSSSPRRPSGNHSPGGSSGDG
jgi:hypothetical protein